MSKLEELRDLKMLLESINDKLSKMITNEENTDDSGSDSEERIAVYSVTPNCYEFTIASVKSLLVNSNVDKIILFINEDKCNLDLPPEVVPINVSSVNFISPLSPNYDTKYTHMCLNRLGFHRLLPDTKKILSLDYDTIIDHDISDLWDIDMSDFWIAGVPERDRTIGYYLGYFNGDDFAGTSRLITAEDLYVNAGVLIMNLEKIREDDIGDRLLDEVNREYYKFPEQDVINIICKGGVYPLDDCYNVSRFTYSPTIQKIIHYAGQEKKLDTPVVKRYYEMSWDKIAEHRKYMYGK